MLQVSQVMQRLSICLYNYNTIGDALALMREKKVSGLPLVNEQGHLLGMVTKEQVLDKGLDFIRADQKASEYLTTRFIPLKEDALIEDVWDLPFEVYPVLNNQDKITGVVSKYALGQAYFQHSELRRQELEAVFDCAHNGILAINKQGIITSLNPAAEKPARSTRAEAVGRFLTDVIVPTGLLEVVRTGVPEFGIKFQVGKRQYITNRTPVVKDGEVIGAVGIFQDVSEIENTLQELRSVKHLNEELRTIVDSSYDGIIICNVQGDILRCNPAVERILGISVDNLMGHSFKELVDKGVLAKNIVHLVKKQESTVSILESPYEDHSLIITGNPVFDEEGEMTKIVINIRDMSELLVLKEALEESKQLAEKYLSEITQMRNQLEPGTDLVARSPLMRSALDLAERVSQVDSPVVLIGERGVGKEDIARIIHHRSNRNAAPFYKISCSSLPESLLEIELFGSNPELENTNKTKKGILELARTGTVYLEDIGEMPLGLQVKLVQFLQGKSVRGQNEDLVDVRIIASANRSLKEILEEGNFSEELFFRLNVVPIKVPSLRDRKEDIIPLIHYHLAQNNKRYSLEKEFSPEAVYLLLNYEWPGNVRELANVVERLVVTTKGNLISGMDVDFVIHEKENSSHSTVTISGVIPLKMAIDEVERQLVTLAMDRFGTTVKAAEALEVNQSTVVRKLKKLKGVSES